MSGRTTAGGETFLRRIPTSVPIPTVTPAESASTQSLTGIAQAMIPTKKIDPKRSNELTIKTLSIVWISLAKLVSVNGAAVFQSFSLTRSR